jgi:hypothetical protein
MFEWRAGRLERPWLVVTMMVSFAARLWFMNVELHGPATSSALILRGLES